MSKNGPLNKMYLPDDVYPTRDALRAAQEILGIYGSHAGRRVKHDTDAETLAKQLIVYSGEAKGRYD